MTRRINDIDRQAAEWVARTVETEASAELLRSLDGREITRMDGNKLVLHLAGARIEPLRNALRDELLGWLVNPNIALLFLIGGALLIWGARFLGN